MIDRIQLVEYIKLKYIKDGALSKGIGNMYKDTTRYSPLVYYTSFLPQGSKISERVFCLLHEISVAPLCSCGNKLKFIRFYVGYTLNCSCKCAGRNENTKQKRKVYYLLNFGVDHNLKVPEIKLKKDITCVERYGVINPSQNIEIKQKREDTFQKKYGEGMGKHLNRMSKETIRVKYDVTNISQLDFVQDKIVDKKIRNNTLGSFVGGNSILCFTELDRRLRGLDSSIKSQFGKNKFSRE